MSVHSFDTRQHIADLPQDIETFDIDIDDRINPLEFIIKYNGQLNRVVLIPLEGKLHILVDD